MIAAKQVTGGGSSTNATLPTFTTMPFNLTAGQLVEVNQSNVTALAVGTGNNGTAYVNLTQATPPNTYNAIVAIVGSSSASSVDRATGATGGQVIIANMTFTQGGSNITGVVGLGPAANAESPPVGSNTTFNGITALGATTTSITQAPGAACAGGTGNNTANAGTPANGGNGGNGGNGTQWITGEYFGCGGGGGVDGYGRSNGTPGNGGSNNSGGTGQYSTNNITVVPVPNTGNAPGGGGGICYTVSGTAQKGTNGTIRIAYPGSARNTSGAIRTYTYNNVSYTEHMLNFTQAYTP